MRALWLGLVLCSTAAVAACPLPEGAAPGLERHETAARLKFLRDSVELDAARVSTWRLAWGAVYGVGTIAQLAALPALSRDDQPDFYVGAIATAVGVGFTMLSTPDVMDDGPALARLAGGGTLDGCALLAEAERVTARDAASELAGVAWYQHALNVGFNTAVGLIIGLAFGHWVSAVINFLVGVAIGEGTLLTQPTRLASQWERYLAGTLDGGAAGPTVSLAAGGVALRF